jgi:hypothetical protein
VSKARGKQLVPFFKIMNTYASREFRMVFERSGRIEHQNFRGINFFT